jgi:hypothetical protein
MQRLRARPDLVMPASVDGILTRRIKANLSAVRAIQSLHERGELVLRAGALERGKQRVEQLVAEIRRSRRKAGKGPKSAKLAAWEERKKLIRDRVAQALQGIPMRAPEQVLRDLAGRIKRLGDESGKADSAAFVVRVKGGGEAEVLKRLASVSGGRELSRMGAQVRPLKVGKAQTQYFQITFPVSARRLGREALNIAWALKKSGAFEAAWPSERKLYLFADDPTHADHAPRTFAWHVDMIRGRQAHDLAPGDPQGGQRGAGAVVAHGDTGWAPHPEYNQRQIDVDRSHNVITGNTGGRAARHSIKPEDKDAPMITHGSATGSLIVGGPPSDRPDTANIAEDDLDFEQFLGGRRPFVEGPQVKKGHILGIAPAATVVPIRFISNASLEQDENGIIGSGVIRIGDDRFIDVIDYAVSVNADVLSLSVGGIVSDAVRQAFDDAILNHDLIVVAAAGQTYFNNVLSTLSGEDSVIEPARFQHVIAVAGCAVDGRPWDESHRGPNVDITAPADAIWVAEFDKERVDEGTGDRRTILECASGTSFATAIMAGAAALWVAHWGGRQQLKQRYPDTPLAWVFREVLQRTAKPVFDGNWDSGKYGPGVVNLERLLKEELPAPEDIPEPPATVTNLLTTVEDGIAVFTDVTDWLGDRYREGEAAVRTGIGVAAGLLDAGLAAVADGLAIAYGAAEDAVGAAAAFIGDAIASGEQLLEDGVAAAEDLGEAAVDAGEDVVEDIGNFVEDTGEGIGEVADTVAGWFGF